MDDKLPKSTKPLITRTEFEQMESDAEKAKELLEAPEFEFFRNFLKLRKEEIVSDFVNNRIHEIVEVKPQSRGGDLRVKHTKQEQSGEMAGEFKFIFSLIGWLQEITTRPKEAEKAQEKGKVTIEGKKDK